MCKRRKEISNGLFQVLESTVYRGLHSSNVHGYDTHYLEKDRGKVFISVIFADPVSTVRIADSNNNIIASGWSKAMRYQPSADKFDMKTGVKIALGRACVDYAKQVIANSSPLVGYGIVKRAIQ